MTHGFFIWSAYLISGVVLGGLTLYLLYDGARQKRLLAKLEAKKTPRRPRGMPRKTTAKRKTK